MAQRCSDYWVLDQAWVKAEKDSITRSNGTAQAALRAELAAAKDEIRLIRGEA